MRFLVVASFAFLAVLAMGVVRGDSMEAEMGEAFEMESGSGQLVDAQLVDSLEAELHAEVENVDYISEKSKPAIWEIDSNRFVASSFMGIVIGNVPKGAHIVCEEYRTGQKKSADLEHASFCWGYLKEPAGYFGGWHGKTSCGHYPIIRTVGQVKQRAKRVKELKGHKSRCGKMPTSSAHGDLADSKLYMKKSYVTGTGVGSTRAAHAGPAGCQAYLNFDNHLHKPRTKYAMIPAGKKIGHRYNTKKGGFSMVKVDGLDPAGDFKWFFVESKCLPDLPANNAPQKGD